MSTERTKKLTQALQNLYQDRSKDLLYHGWHHIYFVTKKALVFSEGLHIDVELLEASALTHALNYLVEPNSEPEVGAGLREEYLQRAGFTPSEIKNIENTVNEAHTRTRHAHISDAAKALSDADTLYKSLPTTPVVFTGNYLIQNKVDIGQLADKIVREQRPLIDQGIYFYTDMAKKRYLHWAKTNLELWENVAEAANDPDVKETIEIARQLGVMCAASRFKNST